MDKEETRARWRQLAGQVEGGNWAESVPVLTRMQVVREVALAAGAHGMVGGQVLDLDARERVLNGAGVERLHAHKTSAILRAATVCGGLVGGASCEEVRALEAFGIGYGTLFQLTDDLLGACIAGLDVTPDEGEAAVSYDVLFGEEAWRQAIGQVERAGLEALSGDSGVLRALVALTV